MKKEFEEVPFSPEKDINPQSTVWKDGKCVKLDEGMFVTYYAAHREEHRTEMQGEKMDQPVDVTIMKAYPVRLPKGGNTAYLRQVCPEEYMGEILPLYVADHFEEYKAERIAALVAFDKSPEVNSFLLNGQSVWLDKDTRVGLMNSTQITKAAGGKDTVLWFNGYRLTTTCDLAIQMLSVLEMYALACYNRTEEHRAFLDSIKDPQLLISYDFTTGYPERPDFKIAL